LRIGQRQRFVVGSHGLFELPGAVEDVAVHDDEAVAVARRRARRQLGHRFTHHQIGALQVAVARHRAGTHQQRGGSG